jgi:hypothetical protein
MSRKNMQVSVGMREADAPAATSAVTTTIVADGATGASRGSFLRDSPA